MLKPIYTYYVYDLEDQTKPIYSGTAKKVARKMFIDPSCLHKAARNKRPFMKKYMVLREEKTDIKSADKD